MPNKGRTVKAHHLKTAIDFRRWLDKNPDADLKRQAEAFNSIADANFHDRKQVKTKNVKAKVK